MTSNLLQEQPIRALLSLIILTIISKSNAYVNVQTNRGVSTESRIRDTTEIGSLTVPTVGVGTISWSSNSLTSIENDELEEVVDSAYRANGSFFDTAESKF
mmetsp:Transcript_37686/g.87784  ORF Transcript_37686/g.87784 Transcript_37686/m.87784 type:complete len:101 (-) Transcript_37686:1128-1430(-)